MKGYFPSEMTDRNQSSDEKHKSEFPQEKIEAYGHVPIHRPGREEEMGMAVLFLAKNQYINGEIIAVDGGVLNTGCRTIRCKTSSWSRGVPSI